MRKLQLEIIQKESPEGVGEKPHIISPGILQTESNQLTDNKLDQVASLLIKLCT